MKYNFENIHDTRHTVRQKIDYLWSANRHRILSATPLCIDDLSEKYVYVLLVTSLVWRQRVDIKIWCGQLVQLTNGFENAMPAHKWIYNWKQSVARGVWLCTLLCSSALNCLTPQMDKETNAGNWVLTSRIIFILIKIANTIQQWSV